MKYVFAVLIAVSSVTSFAAWNEAECSKRVGTKTIQVEIEESLGSHFKDARLIIMENGSKETFDYTVTTRVSGFGEVEYSAPGFTLNVNFWPDQRPQWGMTYNGVLHSAELESQYIQGFRCRFPNIR